MPSESSSVGLYFTLGTETLKVLSIPRNRFANYSFRPLKWLRFLGYAIYGAEGDVFEMDGLQHVDYNSVTDAAQLKDGYRFLSLYEPHSVDSHTVEERVFSASTSSCTTGDFEQTIQARDKGCVVTRETLSSLACHACHILPLEKNDSYIKAVTYGRGQDNNDLIESMTDVRNGLMLLDGLDFQFRRGSFSFLETPNFALDTADVPKSIPVRAPGDSELDIPSDDGRRYTIHLFPDFATTLVRLAPSGAAAWFPETLEEEHSPPPSTLLLDFWYGCAALRAWGEDDFRSFSEVKMDKIYYPQGRTVHDPSGDKDEDDDEKASNDAPVESNRPSEGATRGLAGSDMNDILDVMMAFSKKQQRRREETAEKGADEAQGCDPVQKIERDEKQESVTKVND